MGTCQNILVGRNWYGMFWISGKAGSWASISSTSAVLALYLLPVQRTMVQLAMLRLARGLGRFIRCTCLDGGGKLKLTGEEEFKGDIPNID